MTEKYEKLAADIVIYLLVLKNSKQTMRSDEVLNRRLVPAPVFASGRMGQGVTTIRNGDKIITTTI